MKLLLAFIVIWFGLTAVVSAGSTALSASKFVVQGEPGAVSSEPLRVSNLSESVQEYRFYPEDGGVESRKSLSVTPSDFKLQPQESVEVMVRFRQSDHPWRTNLNLAAYNMFQNQSNFRVGDGIKIPVVFAPPQIAGAIDLKPVQRNNLIAWNILVFGIDFTLFFVVCYWYYQRHFWWRSRLNRKINFL